MASTESTKPSSPASHGSATSSTTTVAPSAAGARCGRPSRTPSSGDEPHRGGPHHARRRVHDEHHRRHRRDRDGHPGRPRAGRTADVSGEHEGGDQREVRTRHRRHVRQPGGAQRARELVGDRSGVADGDAREQRSGVARERRGERPHAVPEPRRGRRPRPAAATATSGAPPLSSDRDRPTARLARAQPPGGARPEHPEGTAAHDDGPSTSTWPVAPDSRPAAADAVDGDHGTGRARVRPATPAAGRSARRRRLPRPAPPRRPAPAPGADPRRARPSGSRPRRAQPRPRRGARATTGPTAVRDGGRRTPRRSSRHLRAERPAPRRRSTAHRQDAATPTRQADHGADQGSPRRHPHDQRGRRATPRPQPAAVARRP